MFPSILGDDETTQKGRQDLRALRNHIVGESSVAFRVGVITSDKGHVNAKFAEVNNLVRKNHE